MKLLNLNSYKMLFFAYLFFFPLMSSCFCLLSANEQETNIDFKHKGEGSNYDIIHSVKYEVKINFFLRQKSNYDYYCFKFARLNDRQPDSSVTEECPPYQISKLKSYEIEGYYSIEKNFEDEYGNRFDIFNASLSKGDVVELSRRYKITLNDIKFKNIDNSIIGKYDEDDEDKEIFELYCNNAEEYYDIEDDDLIDLSDDLVDSHDNPIEKAEKIFTYVNEKLKYKIDRDDKEEKGASWAYRHKKGDCSEFSSLFVTLLRIQGIPARKVCGFLVSDDPELKPDINDKWEYVYDNFQRLPPPGYSDNLLVHAWAEYYVPNIGWIACDPLWHSEDYDYFNNIDFLRFTETVGSRFLIPGAYPPDNYISEFVSPLIVLTTYADSQDFEFEYKVKIKVLDNSYSELNFLISMIFLIVMLTIIGFIALSLYVKHLKKKKSEGIFKEKEKKTKIRKIDDLKVAEPEPQYKYFPGYKIAKPIPKSIITVSRKTCPNCGYEKCLTNARFCRNCGKKLEQS